jgi:hypothetical protein
MSEKITIKNDTISTYLNTDDGLMGFTKAVDNGQTRLALQVLVEVVEQLIDRVCFLENIIKEDLPELETVAPQEEVPMEEKDSIQKAKTTSNAPDEAPANSSMIEEKKK